MCHVDDADDEEDVRRLCAETDHRKRNVKSVVWGVRHARGKILAGPSTSKQMSGVLRRYLKAQENARLKCHVERRRCDGEGSERAVVVVYWQSKWEIVLQGRVSQNCGIVFWTSVCNANDRQIDELQHHFCPQCFSQIHFPMFRTDLSTFICIREASCLFFDRTTSLRICIQ